MRAIIIEEERFTEILALIKAECTDPAHYRVELEQLGVSEDRAQFLLEAIWRTFNYKFVRWAQSHGASCVR